MEAVVNQKSAAASTTLFERISTGTTAAPRRALVYGVHGVGKSSFASRASNPIFLQTEDGLNDIDCARFPLLKSFGDIKQAIGELYSTAHDFKTVVIDSLDWLEPLIWQHTCDENNEKSIESFGYGRGYVLALTHWRFILDGLDALRRDKGMQVVLVAHSKIERFESPDSESYDRYTPRLHKLASATVMEWCDEVFFATFKVFTKTVKGPFNKERAQGIGTGERIMRTVERPSCLAKNRLGLPEELLLDWGEYSKFFSHNSSKGTSS